MYTPTRVSVLGPSSGGLLIYYTSTCMLEGSKRSSLLDGPRTETRVGVYINNNKTIKNFFCVCAFVGKN